MKRPSTMIAVAMLWLAGASHAAARETVRVESVDALFAALGSDRVIVLAPGIYDLAQASPVKAAHLEIAPPNYDRKLVVRGLQGLELRGPDTGEARLYTTRMATLEFDGCDRLSLSHLAFAPPESLTYHPGNREPLVLRLRESNEVVLEDLRWTPGRPYEVAIEKCAGATLRRIEGSGTSLTAPDSKAMTIRDCELRDFRLSASGSSEILIQDSKLHFDLKADDPITAVLGPYGEAVIAAEGVSVIDGVTGKLRHRIARRTVLRAATVLSRTPFSEKRRVRITGVIRTDEYEEPARGVEVWTADGKLPLPELETASRMGVDTSSIEVRHLGSARGPTLVTWTDIPQGNGAYQDFFYVLWPSRPRREPLLSGTFLASGHQGAATGGQESIEFSLTGGMLTVRRDEAGVDSGDAPGPGCVLEFINGADSVYWCEYRRVSESVYRWSEGGLTPMRFDQYVRIEPNQDVGALLREGWRPVWPTTAPAPRSWLHRALSVEEGERAYPRRNALEASNP